MAKRRQLRQRVKDPEDHLPLSPKAFHILLAISEHARNGYQISQSVEENSEGRIKLGPASQFENIHKLSAAGLVEEVADDPVLAADGRNQRFWRITPTGVRAMRAEVARLERQVALARRLPRLRLMPK